ncbi:hypothetical protein [Novosphingobium sp. FKTRR1]|uniref:hypothetical protein n=1 Tax=Novosphingobium sp. FKTRR1 TaxID=2879118 RepID=UPI001CF04364|nr:hypothetical protein [Novosphingobium sp. FKTRR1]
MLEQSHPLTIEQQRDLVERAVDLLGGTQAAANAIGVNRRNLGRLLSGVLRIHAGTLEKLSAALIAHADECRALERRLNPAFSRNRSAAQDRPPHHDGTAVRRRPPIDPACVAEAAARLGLTRAPSGDE